MFGLHGRFLLILPAAAVLLAAPASAQGYGSSPVYSQSLPPPGIAQYDTYDARRPTGSVPQDSRGRHYYPSNASPAGFGPAFADDAQPVYGHDLESRPLPPPAGATQSDVMRPPGNIGSAPAPAPVATQPPAPQVPGQQPPADATASAVPGTSVMTLPPEDQPETGTPKELPANLKKQLVDYTTKEPAGTIIVDTPNTYLYLVLGHGKALRYGIGVGREGFTWTGTERISRMKEWPDWFPPPEMIERQPYLPRIMAGGPGNPLGARALYLGNTLYRIHGTNQPSTIGQTVSSGCIRLLNEDIEDLYSRVQVGTRVVVLPGKPPSESVASASAHPAPATPPVR
jgi:lipoprotein-anchoring transpeptidase ErfK/SrfK